MSLEKIEQIFKPALNPIPDEPDGDKAKAVVLDTCKSPLEMDVTQMRRGLEKWGFKIREFERLTDNDPRILQEYMLWVDCNYGIELAKTNFENWLVGLSDFNWIGKWDFIVTYAGFGGVPREWTVRVTRFIGGLYHIHGTDAKVPWPDRYKEIVEATRWQRPYIL